MAPSFHHAPSSQFQSLQTLQTLQSLLPSPSFLPAGFQSQSQAAKVAVRYTSFKPEYATSNAARRGPMDDMRQFYRIAMAIIPNSAQDFGEEKESGGGNCIPEKTIRKYFDETFGEAPACPWGLPDGWGNYLADVFEWILHRPVSREEAIGCAVRPPGRPWAANTAALHALGKIRPFTQAHKLNH